MKKLTFYLAILALPGCGIQKDVSTWLDQTTTTEQMLAGIIVLLVTLIFIIILGFIDKDK